MHIALCHDALIPPPKYGGTERILYWLAKGLHELGHKTTLLAKPGSHAPGAEVIELRGETDWEDLIPKDADVIHLWSTPARVPAKPFVVTIEGNGSPGEIFHQNTLFISKKHAENHGASHFVYNGIDINDYVSDEKRENYLVFLAKASWKVKNLKGAIAVARAAGLDLEVLGSRDWPLNAHKLLPRIRGVRYHGMVGDIEKRKVLSKARGLLFPVRWHEPFGIAITEALASGCPVFGTPYGSLPEIITPDVGFLSADGRELVKAITTSQRFSPQRCRQRVLEGFSHLDMARSYLKHYEAVIGTGKISEGIQTIPRTKADFVSEELLPWKGP